MGKRAAKPEPAGVSEAGTPPARITTLDEVIGQVSARRVLQAALRSGRVHHAWIFHGPGGVGKCTAAYAFAAALVDPTTAPGLTGEVAPEPGSAVQQLCRSGTHPDVHIITKELAASSRDDAVRRSKQSNIARAVLEEFFLEPAAKTRVLTGQSLMGKVFIIDEAEMLDPVGQNLLLKTLEEPPVGTAIILVTSNEDRLLPTIRSRCQRVAFGTLDEREMERWLERAGIDIDPRRRAWVLGFAAGAPGLARLAIDADLYHWHEVLVPMLAELDRGRYSPDLGPTMAKLIAERAEADVKANPDASKDGANKAWARRMLAFLAEHQRSLLRSKAGSDPDDPAMARALWRLDAINAAEGFLASNVNLAMLLENLAAQLACEPAPC